MTKRTGAKAGAFAFLIAGIAIGYIAAQGGLGSDSALAQAPAAKASSTKAMDKIPDDWTPWKDPNDPNVLLLDGEDPTLNAWNMRRDTSDDPARDPGPVNPQRYAGGLLPMGGFPSYLGAPLAFNTADLKAGKVEVALVGLNVDDNLIPGGRYAANAMRTLTDYMTYPHATDQYVGIDYLEELSIVDYGNVASNYGHDQRSLEEIHIVMSEILAADTMPMAVGGSHIQMYAMFTALAEKYGPKSFAMLHVDAHYDAMQVGFGRFVHNGRMIHQAVERGIIDGEDIIQIGLRGPAPADGDLKWMRDNKLKFHFMSEIERDGFDKVLRRVLEEVKGKKLLISFDMDGLDPSVASAVGTQEPDGLLANQGMQLVRALAIQNEVVACEFNEYNPLIDDAHQTTGILMDRLMRSTLAGLAARKKGITDPFYLDPKRLDHSN